MSKWKIFGKPKPDEEKTEPGEDASTDKEEPIKEEQDTQDKPLAEYTETLQTGKKTKKSIKKTDTSNQRVWRDVKGIEENIDNLHITRAKKPVTDLDRTVDRIIDKNKTKSSPTTHRKQSNVIYVVSKPQPGEVRGDWAVRSHDEIISHHKTKEKAIDEARKIAKNRDATVMVQNTDGTFSDGFKPRK